jgi:hypothetical protein
MEIFQVFVSHLIKTWTDKHHVCISTRMWSIVPLSSLQILIFFRQPRPLLGLEKSGYIPLDEDIRVDFSGSVRCLYILRSHRDSARKRWEYRQLWRSRSSSTKCEHRRRRRRSRVHTTRSRQSTRATHDARVKFISHFQQGGRWFLCYYQWRLRLERSS